MIFQEQFIKGLYLIEPEKQIDERGFFARIFCEKDFASKGLDSNFIQSSIAFNFKKGTLRGMHFQMAPHEETKIVRCTRGAIFDVVVDLRPNSPTLYKWFSIKLCPENRYMLYIPKGLAHGFQTLEDHTEVFYQMAHPYNPDSARGIRWDDPAIGITWPLPVSVISNKDQTFSWI
jgi:dTDP-4-dehydrorhamnose 3,5-epimerase